MRRIALSLSSVLIVLSLSGCIQKPDSGPVKIEVNLAGIAAAQRETLDSIELTVSGSSPLGAQTFEIARGGDGLALVDQALEAGIGPFSAQGQLYIRVSAKSGEVEIAFETQVIRDASSQALDGLRFELVSWQSPNDCYFTRSPSPIFDGIIAGSFDIASTGDGFVLAYTDRSSGRALLHSVELDANGAPKGTPARIDSDIASGVESLQPMLVRAGDGFVLASQRTETAGTARWMSLKRLSLNGAPTGASALVSAGAAEDVRPAIAFSGDRVAVAWRMNAGAADRVLIATYDPATLAQKDAPRDLGGTGATTGFVTLAARAGGGFAAAWAEKTIGDGYYDVRFALLAQSLGAQSARWIRQGIGHAVIIRMTAVSSGGYLVSWEDNRFFAEDLPEQIYTAHVSADGTQVTEHRNVDPEFTESANWPNMALGAESGLMVYYQFRGLNPGPQIFATRMGIDGTAFGEGDVQVSQDFGGSRGARFPDVAYAGDSTWQGKAADAYGLVWIEEEAGVSARLTFSKISCIL